MKQRAVVCVVALFAAGACTSSKQVSAASSSTSVTKSICTRRPATASELKDAQRAPRGTQGSDFIEIMTLKSVPLEASPVLFLSLIRFCFLVSPRSHPFPDNGASAHNYRFSFGSSALPPLCATLLFFRSFHLCCAVSKHAFTPGLVAP